MTNVDDLLRDHVTLTVECLDRIYLNGYIPTLQMPGQLVNFLISHRGNKIPSPALLGRITDDFKAQIQSFAEQGGIPIVHFEPGQRKDDIAAEYRQKFDQPEGVVFIGVAQEKAQAFKGRKKDQTGYIGFEYSRDTVRVNHYYFYIQDATTTGGLHQGVQLCAVCHQRLLSQRPRVGPSSSCAQGRYRLRDFG